MRFRTISSKSVGCSAARGTDCFMDAAPCRQGHHPGRGNRAGNMDHHGAGGTSRKPSHRGQAVSVLRGVAVVSVPVLRPAFRSRARAEPGKRQDVRTAGGGLPPEHRPGGEGKDAEQDCYPKPQPPAQRRRQPGRPARCYVDRLGSLGSGCAASTTGSELICASGHGNEVSSWAGTILPSWSRVS